MTNSRKSEHKILKQLQLEKLKNLRQKKREDLLAEIAKLKSQIKPKVEQVVIEELRDDLLKAIKQNNSAQIKILVELKADPNDVFDFGNDEMQRGRKQTMLTYAISKHCAEAIKTLLEVKADPNLATPAWELWYGNRYSRTLQHTYNAKTPLEHAISSDIHRPMSEAEQKEQPKLVSNSQGYLDILSQKNIIDILLWNRAAITDDARKQVTSDHHRFCYGDSISSMLEDAYLDKIRIAEMKTTFELMSNNREKGKNLVVYMPDPLTNLIASYLTSIMDKRILTG